MTFSQTPLSPLLAETNGTRVCLLVVVCLSSHCQDLFGLPCPIEVAVCLQGKIVLTFIASRVLNI